MSRGRALPVDAPFARAVLERIVALRIEELGKVPGPLDELAALQVDAAVLGRLVGALEAHLPDRDVQALEARARGYVFHKEQTT